ncbi:MAG: pyridoxal-phosphate dependent enzyme [Variibacter sp.]
MTAMAKRNDPDVRHDAETIAATLRRLSPDYEATPLIDLKALAAQLGVAQVLAKDEGRRMLGSFKSLGGTYAGLRALARTAGLDIAGLVARKPSGLPALICASDGNHGLAVAAAARFAGASARVFLHSGVPAARARRIAAQGAAIEWVNGTYDDAVDAAAAAARGEGAILVADTTIDPADPVVNDVMAGYGVIAAEIRQQVEASGQDRPTHLFVQAGVGGLAAAMAAGLKDWMAEPVGVIVVEPAKAASVTAGLPHETPIRIAGDLETAAEMLSCGEASAPALKILGRHGAHVITVSEDDLKAAPQLLKEMQGPATTPSGAAGLAGLSRTLEDNDGARFRLDATSRVLIVVSEGALGEET